MRNWSWQQALNGGDTPVCCSTGSQWLGVPSKNGGGEWNWDVSFLFFFFFVCFGTSFAFVLRGRILVTAHRCLGACLVPPTSCRGSEAETCVFVHVSTVCRQCTHYPCDIALSASPLSLSPRSQAFVLHSIIPLLQSGVEKRESGNFIIIASHFCNLYAMRTLRARSYNQVCRNHVRCFTNSWGDGSSSGDYGFPCC